jgi:uncharacterized OB-fold protein
MSEASQTPAGSELDRPLPQIFPWNSPYFEAGVNGRLVLQKCESCHHLIYYPRVACPYCLSADYIWTELSGKAEVYTFAVVWRAQHAFFNRHVPIVLATVTLAEGPLVVSTIVNCLPEQVFIGMPVHVVFDRVSESIALPKFEPDSMQSSSEV